MTGVLSGKIVVARQPFDLVEIPGLPLPGMDGALGERQIFIRDDQVGVDFQLETQSGALRTGAVGSVEAEGARLDFPEADSAVNAGEVLGEEHFFAIDD